MGINKKKRIEVWEKYNHHCAYCGKEIEYKQMQVDHFISQRCGGTDDFENLMPSCRRCNHYKRAGSIEYFRNLMKTLHERIAQDYITKVGLDYGIVKLKPFDGVFYFEKFHHHHEIKCVHPEDKIYSPVDSYLFPEL